jgi:hypothetical protein
LCNGLNIFLKLGQHILDLFLKITRVSKYIQNVYLSLLDRHYRLKFDIDKISQLDENSQDISVRGKFCHLKAVTICY